MVVITIYDLPVKNKTLHGIYLHFRFVMYVQQLENETKIYYL